VEKVQESLGGLVVLAVIVLGIMLMVRDSGPSKNVSGQSGPGGSPKGERQRQHSNYKARGTSQAAKCAIICLTCIRTIS